MHRVRGILIYRCHTEIWPRNGSTANGGWCVPYRRCTSQRASSNSKLLRKPRRWDCSHHNTAGNTSWILPTGAWYPFLFAPDHGNEDRWCLPNLTAWQGEIRHDRWARKNPVRATSRAGILPVGVPNRKFRSRPGEWVRPNTADGRKPSREVCS